MEEKKQIKVSLVAVISVFIIILLTVALVGMYGYYNFVVIPKYKEEKETTLENNNEETSEVKEDNETTIKIENIDIDSEYGKAISSYLSRIWIGPIEYDSCIGEFENINLAPKDYLVACALSEVWRKLKPEEMGKEKLQFSDFNTALIELFGNEAEGLIEVSDIEEFGFVNKNSDGTYYFVPYGADGTWGTEYIIDKIERQDNIFIVTQYEYEYKNNALGYEGEPYKEYIYDRNDNLILKTTIKEETMGTTIVTKRYDENGKEIEITDSFEKFLLTKYRDKLSVRTIQLEYNESNNSFIMKSNKLANNVNKENSKSEYSNEKIIETDHWPLEYDFKTKKWVDDGHLAYYVATDKDKKLCIVDNEKKLVKSFDIVVTNLIKAAHINRMENALTIIQKDGVAYSINISDFTYTQYKFQDGKLQ